jgi:diacylglycerol kinase (ATP)
MKPGKKGIERIIDATKYSLQGFRAAYLHEAAFRQELACVVTGIPLAVFLSNDSIQFLLLVLPLLLLVLVELANSAIEAIVDRVGSERHELSGRAKDMGSAMVFMAILMVIVSWSTVLAGNYLF